MNTTNFIYWGKSAINFSLKKRIVWIFVHIHLFCVFACLLPFCFFFSCSSSTNNVLLLRADSLMELHPDSALYILESIPESQILSRSDKAFYALLFTQARHKNGISIVTDSLIKSAVDYYDNGSKSLRAAQAYYYLGVIHRNMGYVCLAIEEYRQAIRLMPGENRFLVMIYNELAEAYLTVNRDEEAMKIYRKSCQLMEENAEEIHSLWGIAHIYMKHESLDSAFCYYQRTVDCMLAMRDSSRLPILYCDLAKLYCQKKEYLKADEYLSKAISDLDSIDMDEIFPLKGTIMFGLGQTDSARYYFDKNRDKLDARGKAIRYENLFRMEKGEGNWKAAVENADSCLFFSTDIRDFSKVDSDKVILDYQVKKQKANLSQRVEIIIDGLFIVFSFSIIIGCFWFFWKDRKREKLYIALQQELAQKRVDAMLLKEEVLEKDEKTVINKLVELRERQLQLCISMFQTMACYKRFQAMEKATPKQLLLLSSSRIEIRDGIRHSFIDVMSGLKEYCSALTIDDQFYCVLSLLSCSKPVMMTLMDASPDAIKTRKNRIKNKMSEELFSFVFPSDN